MNRVHVCQKKALLELKNEKFTRSVIKLTHSGGINERGAGDYFKVRLRYNRFPVILINGTNSCHKNLFKKGAIISKDSGIMDVTLTTTKMRLSR